MIRPGPAPEDPDDPGREPSFSYRRAGGLEVLGWPALDALGVTALVTTRGGGVSDGPYASLNLGLHVGDEPGAVVENRQRAAVAAGASLDDLVLARQVHGRQVVVVDADDRGRGALDLESSVADADALVTRERGVVLAILVADCVPLVLYDPVARVLACVHAGWRGTVARVARAAVEVMATLGARPEDVVAGIGPAVSPATYQVGPEVVASVRQAFGPVADELLVPCPETDGRALLDLWAANAAVLEETGVPAGQVHQARVATGEGSFFSDRAVRPCGRFGLLAHLGA